MSTTNRAPSNSSRGGSWSGWSSPPQKPRISPGQRAAAERRNQRRQPSNSNARRATPQRAAPTQSNSLYDNLTRQPRRDPGPAPAPKQTTTPTPRRSTPTNGVAGGAIVSAIAVSIDNVMRGDWTGALRDAAAAGAGYAAAAAAVTAAAAAAGVTAPAWVVAGGGIAGAYLLTEAANKLWPSPPGDGTEGSPQTPVEILPDIVGRPGQVPGKQYTVLCDYRVDGKRISTGNLETGLVYTVGRQGVGPVGGPILIQPNGYVSSFWGFYFTFNGQGATPTSGASGLLRFNVNFLSISITRQDGTSVADDIAQGLQPTIPGWPATQITQNIQIGDTIINYNPAPPPPGKTPVAPPPVAPPQPATPTPTGTGSGGATPSPSPNPQPAPPLTNTPSAPTTTAGTPTRDAPTTGPRSTAGGSSSQAGAQGSGRSTGSGAGGLNDPGRIAALIAATSPGVAGAIGAINNAARPRTPTPSGEPIRLPGDNSPTTGPDNRPPGQGDPNVIPGRKTWIINSQGEIVGVTTEYLDKDGRVIYSITETRPNSTANTVTNQINQSTQQQQQQQQNLLNQITNPSPTPTNTTTINAPTPTEQIQETITNSTQTITQNTTTAINQSTTTITDKIDTSTGTLSDQLLELSQQADADLASTLAIIGTLATTVALNQSTQTITTAISNIPTPTPCTYPTFHPQNQAERAAISSKVDGVNTVLGTVTNLQIAEAKTGITSIIDKIGTPISGGAATLFEGINKIQVWGDKFSKSLRLDRVYNALAVMLQIHNAAILSRNLGESLGFLIDASLQALRLKDENDEEFNLTEVIGTSVENFIKSIIGNEIYEGLSRRWKLISAIYTSAINIYEMSLSAFGGLAEGVSVIGEYQGKIGNALKRSGGVLQNAYDWMEENFKIKMSRAGYLGRVADGLQEAEDVVSNVTEFPESINEIYSTYDEAADEIKDARQAAEQLRLVRVDKEIENKLDSASPNIADNDAFKPPI